MFWQMRRSKQCLSEELCKEILERNTSGVLALADEDYPYAVPLSYVFNKDKIYFHSALSGHKISAIKQCDKASFCVIDRDEVKQEQYTTCYRSVIAFGNIHIVENEQEIKKAMQLLARKYNPSDSKDNQSKMIEAEKHSYAVLGLSVNAMSGKQSIDLVKQNTEEKID